MQKKCFVIMPFGKEGSPEHERNLKIYQQMIKPVVEACGFESIRGDELEHFGNITRDIIELLYESDLVIADLSGRNANVYYELGVRHTLLSCGTIPIIRKGEVLPFDIANYRAIFYDTELDGPEKLRNELKRRIEIFIKNCNKKSDNPVHDIIGHKIKYSERDRARLKEAEEKVKSLSDQLKEAKQEIQQTQKAKTASEKEIEKFTKQIEALQQEIQSLKRPKEDKKILSDSKDILKLRATPQKLSGDDVKEMLQHYDFYARNFHSKGKGIQHAYEIQKDGKVIFDGATGLMWKQSGSIDTMNFYNAKEFVKKRNQEKFDGFDDWRLPTLEEAMSLMETNKNKDRRYIDDKFDPGQDYIWTADEFLGEPRAWVVDFSYGDCLHDHVVLNGYCVRCVRSGLSSGR